MNNPSPAETTVAPDARLFSPGQVAWATFMGNAITGGFLLALNYWKMQQSKKAVITILSALGITGLVFALAMALPQAACNGLYVGQAVAARYLMNALQGSVFNKHLENGGKKASNWAAFGIGLGGMVVMIGVILCVYFANPDLFAPNVVISEKEKVYYDDGATKEQAEKLGKALQEEGFFDGKTVAAASVGKKYGDLYISFPVQDDKWDAKETIDFYTALGKKVAPVIGGPPIHVKLCDSLYMEKRDIAIEK